MSGRTTAWCRASTQVAGHPHEYQEDPPCLSPPCETRDLEEGEGEYSDILIEKHVSRCLTRNHGAIPQTVTRSPRIQSHTASASRFNIILIIAIAIVIVIVVVIVIVIVLIIAIAIVINWVIVTQFQ